MIRIVINKCYGGFGLSDIASKRYQEIKGLQKKVYDYEIPRDDPVLVQVVEELGKKSWGGFSELKVVDIPDGVEWEIEDYDGLEWISERHRIWD